MRAVVMRQKTLVLADIPDPEPGPGEVLVKTLACGICGSDLHALKHAERLAEATRRSGSPFVMDPDRDIVMGHEFCAELVDYGPATARKLPRGTRVCSLPILLRQSGAQLVGYSNDTPGGYSEYMRLTEALLMPVPGGLPPPEAALTEPMAVGFHAVEKARIDRRDVPLVIGCGPVGLAVIAALRLKGAHPIVAADFSSRRRKLAETLGADVVVDPGGSSPYQSWKDVAVWEDSGDAPAQPPWVPGPPLRPAVIFECVGLPGIIDQIICSAPTGARIVVVGVCMERDHFEPLVGINKEVNLQFVLGYTSEEFASTLSCIADGRAPVQPLITGRVGIEGVSEAFQELASPERHAKIMVEPWGEAGHPTIGEPVAAAGV
jgi:threonine dehydrogenase-like Zn-dependent dehydrogenase